MGDPTMKKTILILSLLLGTLVLPAQQKQHGVLLYWQPGSGGAAVTQFDLYRSASASGPWDAAHFIGSVPFSQATVACVAPLIGQCYSFDDRSGVGGAAYFYAVTAADAAGDESAAAVTASAVTFPVSPAVPSVPVSVVH
jgi:hypothetical protein